MVEIAFLRRRLLALAACTCLAVSCSKGPGDTVNDGDDHGAPPSDVGNLAITAVTPTTVLLRWSAPHGGNPSLLAYAYDVRYAPAPLTEATWSSATPAPDPPLPLPPGMQQSMLLSGLTPDTDFAIALKARNSEGDWSHLSNVVLASLPPEAAVVFPDTALDARVRELIGKPAGEIRTSDLTGLQELEANDRGIEDLTGLEACTGLRFLHLAGNRVSDLSPIANLLGLYSLGLWGNQITDLTPLANLVDLAQLGAGSNQITDVGPLAGLTKLEYLTLGGNQIDHILPLGQLENITTLDLSGNRIIEIIAIAGMPKMQTLRLDYNLILGIKPLLDNSGLGSGDEVFLNGNPLSEEALEEDIPALLARGVTVHH